MYGIGNFSCGLRSFIVMIVVPLIAANIILRLMVFFFLSELSREMTQAQENELPDASGNKNVLQRVIRATRDMTFAIYALMVPNHKKMQRSRTISALTFVASKKGTFIVFLILLAPFFPVSLGLVVTDPAYLYCQGCRLAFAEVVEIIAVSIICLLFGIFAAFRVRKYPDPWQLRREATLMCLWGIVILIGFCLGTFFDPPLDVTYDHQVIIVIGFLGFSWVQTVHQVIIAYRTERTAMSARRAVHAKREQKRKKKIADSVAEESTQQQTVDNTAGMVGGGVGGRLFVKQVMANPRLCAEFEKFLVAELGVESLMFLRDTDMWRATYYDISPSARLARAKRLYNTFISPSGTFPINIPSDMVTDLRSALMREGVEDCRREAFDHARQEIVDLLQIGALTRFQSSDMYSKYLEENQIADGPYGGREIRSAEL